MKTIKFISICLAVVFAIPVAAQQISGAAYIEKYKDTAKAHMEKYGIPASIKMAQGMLESGNGSSRLATVSNNHFGIKCKTEWTGDVVLHDDDAPDECFRAYATAEESWTDHSEFLDNRPYYKELFSLDPLDYKGWAHGLRKAGYATDPLYAEKLISIIEDNRLYLLDRGVDPSPGTIIAVENARERGSASSRSGVDVDNFTIAVHDLEGRPVLGGGKSRVILAREGDSVRSLSRLAGLRARRIARINNLDADDPLAEGQPVKL